MNIRFMLLPVLFLAAALSACDTAAGDWRKATAANTVAAYQIFLERHGGDEHAGNARGRILALQDEQAWTAARAANTEEAYNAYLKTEGGGVHAEEARYYLTGLQRAQDWAAIQNAASVASLQAFLQKYPQGVESNQARDRLKELSYRVEPAKSRKR
jgi:hypothetical protein